MSAASDHFVHPSAIVEAGCRIGPGSKIWHFCHLMPGAELGCDVSIGQNGFIASGVRVGDRCRIQNNVSLYEGVILESGVFVGPSAVFTNVKRPRAEFPRKGSYETTRVKHGATIGANAVVVCGVTIGRYAMVGAGSVVTRDVPDHALVVGNPARRAGSVCACGEALDAIAEPCCAACGRRYRGRDGALIELGP